MADRLAAELDRHFQRSRFQAEDDLVFCHPETGNVLDPSKLRKRFATAVNRAGVEELTFHKLRHTFGTQMAAAGAPLRAIQDWMGHADAKTTEIYAHYAPDATGGAAFAERAFGVGRTQPDGEIPGLSISTRSPPERHELRESERTRRAAWGFREGPEGSYSWSNTYVGAPQPTRRASRFTRGRCVNRRITASRVDGPGRHPVMRR